MTEESEGGRSDRFRSAIAAFIAARREAKLKGKEDDADTASKYDYGAWLADAARRVAQIQAVTHVLKATHPDARGSSLHVRPSQLHPHAEVGSHALGDDFAEDIVGNAAALDVFKFLKLDVDGRRLFDWMQDGDPDLLRALHADAAVAAEWAGAFCGLVRGATQLVSHEKGKQLYWLVGGDAADDAGYQLLQPLFSSSLAHAVHADVQGARFGDANKEARQAFRSRKPFDGVYRDYRGLAVRKLGGTKPQNVSQLNSERGGVNYLFASLPPRWDRDRTQTLMGLETVLDRFAWFEGVRPQIRTLAEFLLSDPPDTMATRTRREALERALVQQLSLYAASVLARMEPGWTRDPACKLPMREKLWLDPERTLLPLREGHEKDDQAFNDAYDFGDWSDQVAESFAQWVNQQLREAGLIAVGDVEWRYWARQAIIDAAWPVPMQRRARGVS
ncbi:type I-F CRISPR-associated protein Csy1 [Tahibacter sp. UC22_41]|uniref:type I-F CRISPR-associated protein Csy1 n=1 Tax=Tahibacter sp. UC22_41 TaxID=3350178 RepID=UPI0036D9C705